jgi:hypothetical protein
MFYIYLPEEHQRQPYTFDKIFNTGPAQCDEVKKQKRPITLILGDLALFYFHQS